MIEKTEPTMRRSTRFAAVGWVMALSLLSAMGMGCSEKDTSQPEPPAASATAMPSENAAANLIPSPSWVEASKTWPDTLRYTVDSTLEIEQDGLLLRLRLEVTQDVSGKSFQNERPLACEILMTVRPVPAWPLAQGLVLDSVILHDPLKNKNLPAIHMLAYQRSIDDQTVRTQFLTNMGDSFRQSPDLTEGQELKPTIYLSWDGRIIIASVPPVTLTYAEAK